MNIKELYKNKIDELSSKTFSKDQKDLAKAMIEAAPEAEVGNWYQFIIQKVKLGFTFDAAPEVFQGAISLVKENKELGINLDKDFLEHKLIIGENYDALKNLLLIYRNKIDAIYIDPPYNTEKTKEDGNHLGVDADIKASSFIYRDKFSRTGWLNMMNERLKLAKELLSDEGVIFVSIDDSEQAYLKVLMDEIFGEENFISCMPRVETNQGKNDVKTIANRHDYILVYSAVKVLNGRMNSNDVYVYDDNDGRGPYHTKNHIVATKSQGYIKSLDFTVVFNGKEFNPIDKNGRNRWRWNLERINSAIKNNILVAKGDFLYQKNYRDFDFEVKTNKLIKREGFNKPMSSLEFVDNSFSNKEGTKELFEKINLDFSNPKPPKLIKELIKMIKGDNLTVLDFFAGSGTTGQAVMELNEEDGGNRQFILVTNNENNIGKEITLNRLSNVITGESKNGVKTSWRYSKEKDFLSNNKVKVFELEKYSVSLNDDISELTKTASEELKNFSNGDYSSDEIDIIHDLNSLHPLKEEE